MNSNQVNQLKTVLRKYGNKNSENIVKQETDLSADCIKILEVN